MLSVLLVFQWLLGKEGAEETSKRERESKREIRSPTISYLILLQRFFDLYFEYKRVHGGTSSLLFDVKNSLVLVLLITLDAVGVGGRTFDLGDVGLCWV